MADLDRFSLFTEARERLGRAFVRALSAALPDVADSLEQAGDTAASLVGRRQLAAAAAVLRMETGSRSQRALARLYDLTFRMLEVNQTAPTGDGDPPMLSLLGEEELDHQILADEVGKAVRERLGPAYEVALRRVDGLTRTVSDDAHAPLGASVLAAAALDALRPLTSERATRGAVRSAAIDRLAPRLAEAIVETDAWLAARGVEPWFPPVPEPEPEPQAPVVVPTPQLEAEPETAQRPAGEPSGPARVDASEALETAEGQGATESPARSEALEPVDSAVDSAVGAADARRAADPSATVEAVAAPVPAAPVAAAVPTDPVATPPQRAADPADTSVRAPEPPAEAPSESPVESPVESTPAPSVEPSVEAVVEPSVEAAVAPAPAIEAAGDAIVHATTVSDVLGRQPFASGRPEAAYRFASGLPRPDALQEDAVAFAHHVGVAPYTREARQRYFDALRHRMLAAEVAPGQIAALDLVASLFDYVVDDARMPPAAQPLLWRLQHPALTLAALDAGYLGDDRRSVRRLVENLAAIAVAYADDVTQGSELYRRLDTVVRAVEVVSHAFQSRSTVLGEQVRREYQRAAQGVTQLVSRVANERRALDATPGRRNRRDYTRRPSREREQVVTRRLESELHERIDRHEVPDSVRDFLLGVWLRHLRTAMLRDGEGSSSYRLALQVVDDLLWSLDAGGPRPSRRQLASRIPPLIRLMTQGVTDIGARPEEFRPFLDELFLIHLRKMQKTPRDDERDVPPRLAQVVSEPSEAPPTLDETVPDTLVDPTPASRDDDESGQPSDPRDAAPSSPPDHPVADPERADSDRVPRLRPEDRIDESYGDLIDTPADDRSGGRLGQPGDRSDGGRVDDRSDAGIEPRRADRGGDDRGRRAPSPGGRLGWFRRGDVRDDAPTRGIQRLGPDDDEPIEDWPASRPAAPEARPATSRPRLTSVPPAPPPAIQPFERPEPPEVSDQSDQSDRSDRSEPAVRSVQEDQSERGDQSDRPGTAELSRPPGGAEPPESSDPRALPAWPELPSLPEPPARPTASELPDWPVLPPLSEPPAPPAAGAPRPVPRPPVLRPVADDRRPPSVTVRAPIERESEPAGAAPEHRLLSVLNEVSLADFPVKPQRLRMDPDDALARLNRGDWLELTGRDGEPQEVKVAWINSRRTVVLLVRRPDRRALSLRVTELRERFATQRALLIV